MAVNYGRVAIVPRGAWSPIMQYEVGDVVSHNGGGYAVHTRPPIGTAPPNPDYYQMNGEKGDPGVSIASIGQTQTSEESGGTNVVTVELDDGQSFDFSVKNGAQGADGVSVTSVQQTGTSIESEGINTIELRLSNGTSFPFTVRNGAQGQPGDGVKFINVDELPETGRQIYPYIYAVATEEEGTRRLVGFDAEGNETQYGGTGSGGISGTYDEETGILDITQSSAYVDDGYVCI